MKLAALITALVCVAGRTAMAQAPSPLPPAIDKQQAFLAGGPLVLIPLGSFENIALPSAGLDLTGGYWMGDSLALVMSFDYAYITKQEALSSSTNLSVYGFGMGLRARPPTLSTLRPFVEGVLGVHTIRAADGGLVISESGLLVRMAAGATVAVGPTIELGAKAGYRHGVSLDEDVEDVGGIAVEGFVSLQF